jgi:hypothetical protein
MVVYLEKETPMALSKSRIAHLEETTGHSVFSPSSMKRIILCPGSVLAELKSPIPDESPYAKEGTLLHHYCEKAFSERPDNPLSYVSETDWSSERKVLVMEALEYVLKIKALHHGPVRVSLESKGSLASWGLPEIYGTMDVKIESEARLDVLDYKFGFGIQVFAEGNPQCACYLASSIDYDPSGPQKELYVHVVQPPLNHYDVWNVKWSVLTTMVLDTINNALMEAKSEHPSFNPSMEACRWCNANMICEHRLQSIRKKASAVIKASRSPTTVKTHEWKKILDGADDLQQAIKDVRAFAQREIKSTRGFPGYKLIAGRSKRVFKDPKVGQEFILERLGDEGYGPTPIISLAQAEKKLPGLKKDQEWQDLITKPTGKPVLVPESDPRPALEFSMQNEFEAEAETMGNVQSETSEIKDPFTK